MFLLHFSKSGMIVFAPLFLKVEKVDMIGIYRFLPIFFNSFAILAPPFWPNNKLYKNPCLSGDRKLHVFFACFMLVKGDKLASGIGLNKSIDKTPQ